mgnify:CR=1 FL=1
MLCMIGVVLESAGDEVLLVLAGLVKAVPFTAQLSASEPQPVKKISDVEALMAFATCARPLSTNSLAS